MANSGLTREQQLFIGLYRAFVFVGQISFHGKTDEEIAQIRKAADDLYRVMCPNGETINEAASAIGILQLPEYL